MKRGTVLQIGNGWFPECKGGVENVFYNLYARLPKQGFEVRGLVPGSASVSRETGRQVIAFGGNGTPATQRAWGVRRATRKLLASERPDLVAAHFALYTLPVLDLLRNIPLVVHFHGPWALESKVEGASSLAVATKWMVEKLVLRRASRVIVCSDAFGTLVQERYGIPHGILRHVPCGVDTSRFAVSESRAEARTALGWDSERPIVLTVRRLVRRMGLSNLVQAFSLLHRQHPEALLYIAGTGPERRDLEAQVRAAGIGEVVRFLGSLTDAQLPLAYRAANISIVPTLALEGFGLIAVESLASGTPVLVTPSGGLPEIVRPLAPELVLKGMSPTEIRDGLEYALGNPASLPSDEECRRYAQRHFDWQMVGGAIADVYREVI